MESVLRPCAAVAYTTDVLDVWEQTLGFDSSRVVERMRIGVATLNGFFFGCVEGVECHEDIAEYLARDMLQDIHVVSQTYLVDI